MGENIWILVPLGAFLIPIVVVLTRHQQRMAEILNRSAGDHSDISALRRELAELKSLVHQQTITLDSLASSQRSLNSPPPTASITDRLNTGQ